MKAANTSGGETLQIRLINRWRWIILVLSTGAMFVVEYIEHDALPAEYLLEFVVYGIAIAVPTWILLTYLARQLARQARLQDSLELQRQFSQQLAHYQDRQELAQFIVRFPGSSMPVDQVILFQYDHLTAHLEFVAEWNADEQTRLPARFVPVTADTRYVGTLSKSSHLHEAATCPLIAHLDESNSCRCYCLPLAHDSILVGVLRLRCSPGQTLAQAQMQFLNTLSSQMALALALSIAFPRLLTEAQRAERRRLAYELHDSLAQQIGYLHLGLDRLAGDDRLAGTGWLQYELDRLREVASESYRQVRDNLALLRDEAATDLNQIIGDYVRSIAPQISFEIEFNTAGTPLSLGPATCQQVFGLIRESLNNVQKHAQAQHVRLALQWRTDQLDVTVADDGTGFDPDTAHGDESYGLTMLQERVQDLHGDMRITSAPGTGTSVQFEIPVRAV